MGVSLGAHILFGLESARGVAVIDHKRSTRRHVLRMGAAAGAGLLVPYRDALALDTPGKLGTPLGPYGERSPFEKAVRWRRDTKTPETGSSFSPIQDSVGTLTPSSLHYERHHSGIPTIDPAQHRLVIHGMVDRTTLALDRGDSTPPVGDANPVPRVRR